MRARQPIILDCDPGVDDAIALLLALASPEIEVLGITCVVGNKSLAQTTTNALRICALAGRADIPVHAGCARALMGPFTHNWPSVHGDDGLCDLSISAAVRLPEREHAIDFITRQVLAAPGEVSLCPIGPLTNIALAIVKEPRIVAAIKSIVFMGGVAFGPGNSTPCAEFNFLVDPEAADIVMSSGVPLVMFGLDITRKARITEEHIRALEGGSRVAMATAAMIRAYGNADPCLHDPCPVAYLVAPDIFSGVDAYLRVLARPEAARGSVVAAVSERHRDGRAANCLVITDGDMEALFGLLLTRLASLGSA